MAGFLFIMVIVIICIFLFGKADSKRTVLNAVNLDLAQGKYVRDKNKEFAKYCQKAMKIAIDKYNVTGNNEMGFLLRLYDVLYTSTQPYKVIDNGESEYEYDSNGERHERFTLIDNPYVLEVKNHYSLFSSKVVKRRIEDLKQNNQSVLLNGCNFSNKQHLKKYVEVLWIKYQNPWPADWMQYDGL